MMELGVEDAEADGALDCLWAQTTVFYRKKRIFSF